MYKDSRRWALTFQSYVQLTMLQNHSKKQVRITPPKVWLEMLGHRTISLLHSEFWGSSSFFILSYDRELEGDTVSYDMSYNRMFPSISHVKYVLPKCYYLYHMINNN